MHRSVDVPPVHVSLQVPDFVVFELYVYAYLFLFTFLCRRSPSIRNVTAQHERHRHFLVPRQGVLLKRNRSHRQAR